MTDTSQFPPGEQFRSRFNVLILICIATFLSVFSILWFMNRAIRNEAAAVHQQLNQLYTNQMDSTQRRIDLFWSEWEQRLQSTLSFDPAARFSELVHSDLVTSVIIEAEDGSHAYPNEYSGLVSENRPNPPGWSEARSLEYQQKDYSAAAEAFSRIADEAGGPSILAKARIAQANCMVKAGEKKAAIQRLLDLTSIDELIDTVGSQGALTIPNVQLRILTLIGDPNDPEYLSTMDKLVNRLNDYSRGAMLSSQRRFLMDAILELPQPELQFSDNTSSWVLFPTLTAELLAASYVEQTRTIPSTRLTPIGDHNSPLHVAIAGGGLTALFERENLLAILTKNIESTLNLGQARIELLQPGDVRTQINPIATMSASSKMPEWQLAIVFAGADPFITSINRQKTIYLSTGLLVIGSIAIIIFLTARHLHAQIRLAQMKNELVSTVSHELKTPLSSMKALVETLLAGRVRDEEQKQDYLKLIAKENNRLSHLIDNFLTFSRLEKGRHHFRVQTLAPSDVAEQAIEALHERLMTSGCQFTQQIVEPLPQIEADPDAITTVLVNLLDNALKYTNDPKVIHLHAHADRDALVFTVKDNGIGFSPAERKRIFDRFHQVDQGLTRERGGCGLGLSIVNSIIQAHHGRIEVKSEPGKGSSFRIFLPIANSDSQRAS